MPSTISPITTSGELSEFWASSFDPSEELGIGGGEEGGSGFTQFVIVVSTTKGEGHSAVQFKEGGGVKLVVK